MKEYKYQGEIFQVDDSGCDGSSEWELKVTDGKGIALITAHITRNSQYQVVFPDQAQSSSKTPEEAVNTACKLLIDYRPVALPTSEDACKALSEFVKNL